MHTTVRVRFAPSPTGNLHIGGLRTALFNFLFKTKHHGKLVLRVEDTDADREVSGSLESLKEDFHWAGIQFDEDVWQGGEHAPYFQSKRVDTHLDVIDFLLSKGYAYKCYCSPERLSEVRQNAIQNKLPPRYDRNCRFNTSNSNSSDNFVIRLAVPTSGELIVNDLFRGEIKFEMSNLDDPIIRRSDGTITAILAGAVDDRFMKITHVIRGEEWLPSTPYQQLIHQFCEYPTPQWAHLSVILNENREKLSKRHPGGTVAELRNKGFAAEAIARYLAQIGTKSFESNHGWSLQSLTEAFELTAYRSGEAVFSMQDLLNMNGNWISNVELSTLQGRFVEWLKFVKSTLDISNIKDFPELLELCRKGPFNFQELLEAMNSVLLSSTLDQNIKSDFPHIQTLLSNLVANFEQIQDNEWKTQVLEDSIRNVGKMLELKGKNLFMPIRLVLTNQHHGPELPRIIQYIGKVETINRLSTLI